MFNLSLTGSPDVACRHYAILRKGGIPRNSAFIVLFVTIYFSEATNFLVHTEALSPVNLRRGPSPRGLASRVRQPRTSMLSDTPSCSRYERTLIRRANAPGGRPARSPRPSHPGSLWCCLLICLLVSNGATNVRAVPVAQGDSMTTTTAGIITTGSTDTATPGAIISSTLAQTQSSSHSSALASSTTTTVPGTVVTDSPLVRTNPVSSLGSIFSLSSNQSSTVRSASGSANFPASSSSQSPTIYPSPTSDGDGNTSDSDATDSSTLNSLVNLYFLILGGAIAAALVGWWYWRRRRKGKHTRDRRRGLEALRRDLELGRLRRGFLGVVGRGGGGHSQNSSEELPAYKPNDQLTGFLMHKDINRRARLLPL